MGRGVSDNTRKIVDAVIGYAVENAPVTIRGCCYHLFTKGLIADMSKSATGAVSKILVDAREKGWIDWEVFVDENRELEDPRGWTGLEAFGKYVEGVYRKNPWADQPYHVELWTEKGTVRGLLQGIREDYQLPLRVMHGYTSATCVKEITKVLDDCYYEDKKYVALYAGDWDPSGLDMSERDLPQRLERYSGGRDFTLKRIALTRADIASGLPSFPLESKSADTRFKWYRDNYHKSQCWELDAMNPRDLRTRLKEELDVLIDWDAWKATEAAEKEEREILEAALSYMKAA